MQRRGFSLLPLKGKVPHRDLLPVDSHGRPSRLLLANRPASKHEIAGWYDEQPQLNSYGVMTGTYLRNPGAYLVVFDLDKPELMPEVGGHLPPTPTVKTGRGFHYYFIHKEEIRGHSFSAGDVKGKNAYVVGPGSWHKNGSIYEWCDYLAPWQVEFAELPLWLLEASRAASPLPGVKSSKPSSIQNPEKELWHKNNNVLMPKRFKTLEEMNQDPELAIELMALCGRPEVQRLGQAFLCPIPGHSELTPSASLWQEPGRPVVLFDWHSSRDAKKQSRGARFSWVLPDVYASVMTGQALELKKGERAIWWLRCLFDLGKVHPPEVGRFELPDHATEAARLVYEGFTLLMRLAQLYEPTLRVPFNRKFATRWCITDVLTVRRGMSWLLSRNYIFVASHGRPYGHLEGAAVSLYSFGGGELD